MTGDRLTDEALKALAPDGEAMPLSLPARLRFERDGDGRTFLSRQFTPYPLHLCRPFYVGGDPAGMATVYVQSCAGGLFQHDRLRLELEALSGSAVHFTTSASTIVHGMPDDHARQHITLGLEPDCLFEYMPDPLIMLPQAKLETLVELRLAASARAILCDAFLSHDPSGERRPFDWLRSEVRICDAHGRVLALDRFAISGATVSAARPGIMPANVAHASLFFIAPKERLPLIEALRQRLDQMSGVFAGISFLPHDLGVFVRILADDGVSLRAGLDASWRIMREVTSGAAPGPRRK